MIAGVTRRRMGARTIHPFIVFLHSQHNFVLEIVGILQMLVLLTSTTSFEKHVHYLCSWRLNKKIKNNDRAIDKYLYMTKKYNDLHFAFSRRQITKIFRSKWQYSASLGAHCEGEGRMLSMKEFAVLLDTMSEKETKVAGEDNFW
jgi:hypothetical protein